MSQSSKVQMPEGVRGVEAKNCLVHNILVTKEGIS